MEKGLEYNMHKRYCFAFLFSGIIGILFAAITQNLALLWGITILPVIFILLVRMIEKPINLWLAIFTLNYFIIGINRYVEIHGISVWLDVSLLSLVFLLFAHSAIYQNIDWNNLNNILFWGNLIWTIYCFICIINPTGMLLGWLSSRQLIYNPLLVSIVTLLVITNKGHLKHYIIILSILSFLGALKALMQKFIGFDVAESIWLANKGAVTHIISSGVRYFSFFSDASSMGANMGYAAFVFGVCFFYQRSILVKIWYAIVSACCLYALFISGTRSAVAVPLTGLLAYVIFSKNIKAMIFSGLTLVFIYSFFAFTYIGHGNALIRRMRSSFRPTEDASFNVRLDNQEKFAEHIRGRWFGEGLGLSGVENQKISLRFTTSIPTDSWLVKIWVETGIVGISLYLCILSAIFIRCAHIIMFKVKERQLKGLFLGIIGGNLGLTVASYANLFFGQYPTHLIIYAGFAIIMNYKCLETTVNNTKELNYEN